jgi:hypothetical protein
MDRRAPGTSRRILPVLTGPEGVVAWTGPRGSWRPIMEAPR